MVGAMHSPAMICPFAGILPRNASPLRVDFKPAIIEPIDLGRDPGSAFRWLRNISPVANNRIPLIK